MSDCKTVTHEGKVYQIGGVYEFSDAGKDWAVDELLAVGERGAYPFEARKFEWELIREVNCTIGTITPAPIELVNGAAYMFDSDDTVWLGFYSEIQNSFYDRLSNGVKISNFKYCTNIRLMTVGSK
jgi:hypothetical protein